VATKTYLEPSFLHRGELTGALECLLGRLSTEMQKDLCFVVEKNGWVLDWVMVATPSDNT
jgi:hypothetical protein